MGNQRVNKASILIARSALRLCAHVENGAVNMKKQLTFIPGP